MSENQQEICPVCQVKIVDGDKVLFSSGPLGTRAKLWARVPRGPEARLYKSRTRCSWKCQT